MIHTKRKRRIPKQDGGGKTMVDNKNQSTKNTEAAAEAVITEVSLFNVISLLNDAKDAENFLIDLCTPSEIKAFVERWRVCQLLHSKRHSYRDISEITGASLTTIGRVSRFLNDEKYGGYRKMLQRLEKKKNSD